MDIVLQGLKIAAGRQENTLLAIVVLKPQARRWVEIFLVHIIKVC